MAGDTTQEVMRDIAIYASDDEVNALAELIDLGVKTGGYKVARNAGFWVQKLEEAVAARNARQQEPKTGPRVVSIEESADGAA